MQPSKCSRSSPEAVSWKMCVPATLQPDGAWKRPAHIGPSLGEPPVGLQSPYCTRPPRWAQKQQRGARRQSADQAHPRGNCLCLPRSRSEEGRKASSSPKAFYHSHSHHHPSHSSQNQRGQQLAAGQLILVTNRTRAKECEERIARIDNKQHNSQGKMESIFPLQVHSVMHVPVSRDTQKEADNIFLGA